MQYFFLTDLSPEQQQLIEGMGLCLTPFGVDDKEGFVVNDEEIDWATYALGMKVEAVEQTSHTGVLAACLSSVVQDDQPNTPKVRVLYWQNPSESMDVYRFRTVTEATLLPVLGKDVLLFGHCLGGNYTPIENGRFCIHIWSSPRGTAHLEHAEDQTIFGFRVNETRWRRFSPVNEGEVIENPDSGSPVAELIGNNLFIFLPLLCREIQSGTEIYAKILEEVVARLTMNPAERRSRAREKAKVAFVHGMNLNLNQQIADLSVAVAEKEDLYGSRLGILREHLRRVGEAKEILGKGLQARQVEEILGKEFDQLTSTPGVKRVSIRGNKVIVLTDMIVCQDTRSKKWHEIGMFRIEICLRAEHKVLFFNLCPKTHLRNGGMQAPHVFRDGRPCLGSASEVFAEFLREHQFANLILYAIQFLGSANVADSAGKHVDEWPLVSAA